CAAGMFNHIGENFLHAPSDDVGRDCVQMLSTLMLAQAQEVRTAVLPCAVGSSWLTSAPGEVIQCFWEKAVVDHLKPKVVSKLASSAAQLYQMALDAATARLPSGYLEPWWTTTMQVKHLHFSSVAHYYASQAAEQAEQVRRRRRRRCRRRDAIVLMQRG